MQFMPGEYVGDETRPARANLIVEDFVIILAVAVFRLRAVSEAEFFDQ